MKDILCIIALCGLMMISSCRTTKSLSVKTGVAQDFQNYTLTILFWDAGITPGNTLNQVYEALGAAHVLQTDWGGFNDGNKRIKIKLQMSGETMNRLHARLYAIPNIISVEIY